MGYVISFAGHRDDVLKSDGESSETALKEAARSSLAMSAEFGICPAGGTAANGEVEQSEPPEGAREHSIARGGGYDIELAEDRRPTLVMVSSAPSLVDASSPVGMAGEPLANAVGDEFTA
eukprot:8048216-Pyramimonas_sp.AAC.1